MHSTRGRIRNNLHVQCSVFPLGDFVTLLVGTSKIKAHIYLSIWMHPHRFDKSVPFLSVGHDRCNILPRKDGCHYLPLVYECCCWAPSWASTVFWFPKKWLANSPIYWPKLERKKKKEEAKQLKKKCKLWLFFHVP